MADRIIGTHQQPRLSTRAAEPTRAEPAAGELSAEPATTRIQRVQDMPIAPPDALDDCLDVRGFGYTPVIGGARQYRIQYIINADVVAFPTRIVQSIFELDLDSAKHVSETGEPRLFLVRPILAELVYNQNTLPAAGVGLDPNSRVATIAPGINPSFTGLSTGLLARITLTSPAGKDMFEMTFGAPAIEVFATEVNVAIIGPGAWFEVYSGAGPGVPLAANTIWADAIAGIEIMPIEESLSRNRTMLTMQRENGAGGTLYAGIPKHARSVTIYQSAAGVACTAWTMQAGVPTASMGLGTIPFLAGARMSETVEIHPAASFIQSDIDQANARLFTIAWGLEL